VRQRDVLLLVVAAHDAGSRFGLTVSRKVGNAVCRNRVKRWLREGIRQERVHLQGTWDVVVIAHPSAAEVGAVALREQIAKAFVSLNNQGQGRRT
jgi:ribonuclease P protein component